MRVGTTRSTCLGVVLLSAAGSMAPFPALAQAAAETPARNANIWNGRAHQPEAGNVHADEHAAGVAPAEQRAVQQNRELDQMGQRLIDKANRAAAEAPPPLRPPTQAR